LGAFFVVFGQKKTSPGSGGLVFFDLNAGATYAA
jgi:hypothetical protein